MNSKIPFHLITSNQKKNINRLNEKSVEISIVGKDQPFKLFSVEENKEFLDQLDGVRINRTVF